MRISLQIGVSVAIALCSASAVVADPPGDGDHTHARAGGSNQIAPWARPANSCKFTGDYIGGGCLARGSGRDATTDGTWGWDYVGRGLWPQRVFLNWCHDTCRQPKPGPYRVDGRPVRDVFTGPPGPEARARQCNPRRD